MPAECPWYFDQAAADKATGFFRVHLKHFKGDFAGKSFVLEEWQARIISDIFGWKRVSDGTRRYRKAYIEVPRKNGKTTMAAGIALYLLLCDGEPSPEVYSAAGDRGQARICYDAAAQMVAANPYLSKRARCLQHKITAGSGFYTAISSEAYSKHGFNASGIVFDELHVQTNRDLWDVLDTSTGARRQPLTVAITTAGHDRSSICWQLHQRAKAAMADPDIDPTFYGIIYGAEPEDDWTSEEVWRKANPNYGISIKPESMREACEEAKQSPDIENTFRNLRLDQWTEQAVRWIQMTTWDACLDEFTDQDLIGLPCWAGLDLATTRDLTAFVIVFKRERISPSTSSDVPGPDETPAPTVEYLVRATYWAPRDNATQRDRQDKTTYMNWADQGLINLTEGNVTDYNAVEADIVSLCNQFGVRMIAFDPYNATQMTSTLQDEHGIKVIKFPQTIAHYSEPCKQFDRLLTAGAGAHLPHHVPRRDGAQDELEQAEQESHSRTVLRHNGHPVLRWNVANVTIHRDSNNNIRPDKAKSSEKIDGLCALIMGLALALEGDDGSSIYDEPGAMCA